MSTKKHKVIVYSFTNHSQASFKPTTKIGPIEMRTHYNFKRLKAHLSRHLLQVYWVTFNLGGIRQKKPVLSVF